MKRRTTVLFAMIVLMLAWSKPAAAQQRYIVVSTGGLSSVLNLCSLLGCQVQGSLDGKLGQTFLVTSTNLLNTTLTLLESLLGIVSIERDLFLPIARPSLPSIPYGLYDTSPVNYYGTVVWHGYAAQPAAQIIRIQDAQNGFGVSGTGIVALIDTGVDPHHPVLSPVLLEGYDFTRNQPGASEWLDVTGMQSGYEGTSSNQQPGYVQQSTAAVLDQSTAAVLDGSPYVAFGHGTMTSGLVNLVGIASTTDWDTRSSFSNYGSADVWIAAPGEYVISTYPGGTYASESGTSFSSPLVAGTVALLLSAKQAGFNQSQVGNALANAQVLTPDLNHGRLNVYQAVSAWVNSSSSTTTSSSSSCSLLCL